MDTSSLLGRLRLRELGRECQETVGIEPGALGETWGRSERFGKRQL